MLTTNRHVYGIRKVYLFNDAQELKEETVFTHICIKTEEHNRATKYSDNYWVRVFFFILIIFIFIFLSEVSQIFELFLLHRERKKCSFISRKHVGLLDYYYLFILLKVTYNNIHEINASWIIFVIILSFGFEYL